MRCFCRLACTILVALMINWCSVCPAVSVGNEKELNKLETLGQKISKVTSNPKVRKYFSGALLGSAFAATVQPFKNAKDHFLVWDFKTVRQFFHFLALFCSDFHFLSFLIIVIIHRVCISFLL